MIYFSALSFISLCIKYIVIISCIFVNVIQQNQVSSKNMIFFFFLSLYNSLNEELGRDLTGQPHKAALSLWLRLWSPED